LSSGLKGIGKERTGALIIAACDYCVAVPTAYFFCFVCDLGLVGVAFGTAIAIHLKIIFFFRAYKYTNYAD